MSHSYAQETTYLCESHQINLMDCLLTYHTKEGPCQYKRKTWIYVPGNKLNFFDFKGYVYLTAHQGMSNVSTVAHSTFDCSLDYLSSSQFFLVN